MFITQYRFVLFIVYCSIGKLTKLLKVFVKDQFHFIMKQNSQGAGIFIPTTSTKHNQTQFLISKIHFVLSPPYFFTTSYNSPTKISFVRYTFQNDFLTRLLKKMNVTQLNIDFVLYDPISCIVLILIHDTNSFGLRKSQTRNPSAICSTSTQGSFTCVGDHV